MTVAPLDESADVARFGGKAAQLAALVRAGLAVPAGVALSVELVEAAADGDHAAAAEIERAWSQLHPPLAVRSSAVDEDSEGASFAGQHLTCLNVETAQATLEAVQAVWRSAHSESALAYRARLGLAATPRIAVVLQELVDADRAGVLFTRNPLDGADELVIEAAWGLGEAVVAGLVVPDRFRLARDGTVLERTPGWKDVAVRRTDGGGTAEVAVADAQAGALCLGDADLARLVALAEQCERVFGRGRDLEWAFAGEALFVLQCRAVTRAAARAR